jgi:hypothetical protein
MKVNVKREMQGYLFEDIEAGEVFYSEADPNSFLLRTDADDWVAVDLKTGVLCHLHDFNLDNAQYHIVHAEVNI